MDNVCKGMQKKKVNEKHVQWTGLCRRDETVSVWKCRWYWRLTFLSGRLNRNSRSKRPGLLSAGSIESSLFVAPMTTISPRLSKPSIKASRVDTIELDRGTRWFNQYTVCYKTIYYISELHQHQMKAAQVVQLCSFKIWCYIQCTPKIKQVILLQIWGSVSIRHAEQRNSVKKNVKFPVEQKPLQISTLSIRRC